MKRILLVALALVMCLSTVALLSSCGCKEHTSSGEYEWDANGHWLVCDNCEEKYEAADHQWGASSRVSVGTHKHACTVCKHEAYLTFKTDVTAEQFAAELGTNYTVIGEYFVVDSPNAKQDVGLTRADGKFCVETVATTSSGVNREVEFYEVVGDKVYEYEVDCDKDGNITACAKEEIDATADEVFARYEHVVLPTGLLDDMTKFTYNEESKMYEVAAISLQSGESLTNVKVGFEDGKLVMLEYVRFNTYSYSFEISYNNAVVNLPTVTQ